MYVVQRLLDFLNLQLLIRVIELRFHGNRHHAHNQKLVRIRNELEHHGQKQIAQVFKGNVCSTMTSVFPVITASLSGH